MKLRVGTRLPPDVSLLPANGAAEIERNRAVYKVTEVLAETPWSALYKAKKIFHNYDFKERRLIEVSDDECLDVFVKTLIYPELDQRQRVVTRREHATFEARQVMGCRRTNLIPEPLGFLEIRNDQDAFTFSRAAPLASREPVLICEAIHGQPLVRWRKSRQPEMRVVLRILGELLGLIEICHQEQMLVNHVSPTTFWIDATDRVHLVGTENVIDARRAAEQRTLFPPERYARGFSAPELARPDEVPSLKSDLYGWGAIAYFLVTGDSPARRSMSHSRTPGRFDNSQRALFREALLGFNTSQMADVCQWLGVEGRRFAQHWPDSFIDGVFQCLEGAVRDRPESIPALRQWWNSAPPPRVPTAVAVLKPDRRVEVRFSSEGLPPHLTYQLRRQRGRSPRDLQDGDEIWSGPLPAEIRDTLPHPAADGGELLSTWKYSLFTIDRTGGELSPSLPFRLPLIDGSSPDYALRWVERMAVGQPQTGASESLSELRLFGTIEPPEELFRELMPSQETLVRLWAVDFLSQLAERSSRLVPHSDDLLIEFGLRDQEREVRWLSTRALVRTSSKINVDLIVQRLAPALAGPHLDDRIRAVRSLRDLGVDQSLIDASIATFELDRPATCEVCQQSIRTADLEAHLIEQHNYVLLDGQVLPLRTALRTLWESIFSRGNSRSFRELAGHLARRLGRAAPEALARSFRHQFLSRITTRHDASPTGLTERQQEAILGCLSSHPIGEQLICHLLQDDNPQVVHLARQFFLPRAASELAASDASVASFRQWVEFLTPQKNATVRLEVCDELVRSGADPSLAQAIRDELALEEVVPCPQCGDPFQRRLLERHRRQVHQIFEFEHRRYSQPELIRELIGRVVSTEATLFAALTLVDLFEEQFAAEAVTQLVRALDQRLATLAKGDDQTGVSVAAASSLAPVAVAPDLCHALLRLDSVPAIELGLFVFAHLTQPPSQELLRTIVGRLASSTLTTASKTAAAAALIRWSGQVPDLARKGLALYAASVTSDSLEKIELLQALESRTGESVLIQELCRELAAQRRIRCPKCGDVYRGREMAQHALDAHQRVFDGRNLRRPWSVALDNLEQYASQPDMQLLRKGEELAALEDAQHGKLRFIREALRRGIDPGGYSQLVKDQNVLEETSLCPNCFESIRRPVPMKVDLVKDASLRSSIVEIVRLSDSPYWYSAEITSPHRHWSGPQPTWNLTRRGAGMLAFALVVIPALIIGAVFGPFIPAALTAATILCGAGLLLTIAVGTFYRPRTTHLIDVAWNQVVPFLLETAWNETTEAFIAGLARASLRHGSIEQRRHLVEELTDRLEARCVDGHPSYAAFATLFYLRFVDSHQRGTRESVLVQQLTRLADHLAAGKIAEVTFNLATGDGAGWTLLSPIALTAFRWRLVSRCRAHEWTVYDLLESIKNSRSLRVLMTKHDIPPQQLLLEMWAMLDLEQQPGFPRDSAQTASTIAERSAWPELKRHPELLVAARGGSLIASSAGLQIGQTSYQNPVKVAVKVNQRLTHSAGNLSQKTGGPERIVGYELRVNNHSEPWRTDPSAFAKLIVDFSDLRFVVWPQCVVALQSQPPRYRRSHHIPEKKPVACESCGQLVVHGTGHFAVPWDQP